MQADDRQRAEQAIAKQSKWHHRIEVAPGVWTPGLQDTPTLLSQIGMPEDLSGMRVLDIGARDGFFTFEAERRGAREVVALDNESPHNTGFAIAAELLGSKATYVTENVYSLSPEAYGRFDLVLFLGVIYHLRHPLLALDRIHDVCAPEALLLVETHMIDEGLVDAAGDWRNLDDFDSALRALPIVQYYPEDMLGSDPTSQWAPNRVALEGWLRGSGFDPVSSWQHAFRGGAVARRRQLEAASERAVDEAASWDMSTWTVEKATSMSNRPPA
ncbi:MAG TPA: methyltransferase domain-containing protein [Solirubrobacterales bacterium]|nr:methyltransferase domain-containing protein [Solirubrobacterales bacterium]